MLSTPKELQDLLGKVFTTYPPPQFDVEDFARRAETDLETGLRNDERDLKMRRDWFSKNVFVKHALSEGLFVNQMKFKVIRESKEMDLECKDIVVGDIVVLSSGMLIPADGVVVKSENLHSDESHMTGEPVPVKKLVGHGLYAGTSITGSGVMLVVCTGKYTMLEMLLEAIGAGKTKCVIW